MVLDQFTRRGDAGRLQETWPLTRATALQLVIGLSV